MKSTEIGLLRFMRARTDETRVLNAPGPERRPAGAPADLPARLAAAAHRLRTASVSADGRTVAYDMLHAHPAYTAYRDLARDLDDFDPWTMRERCERIAFWINIYNALSIEAVLAFGLRRSIREAPGFFRRAAYRIGGQRFSAELIEHGILRGNRPPLPRMPPPLAEGDPRLRLCITPPDPRAHFALNCAARSCPPFRVYDAATLDEELDQAAAAFINGGGVSIERGEGREDGQVHVSAIMLYYADDFGGTAGVADWLCRYLRDGKDGEAGEARRAVRQAFQQGIEIYEPYDWALNRVAPAEGDA